jgi:hypothetical protein
MDVSSFTFNKQVQDYLQSCENLLPALSTRNTAFRFSTEEREVLWFSVAQLQRFIVVWDQR